MAYSDSFPAIRPSFQFNADAGRLDSRITFSRSDTPPTYAAPSAVHYWSNEKHLSSENLLKQSSGFDTTWVASNISTPTGGQTDPSGGSDGWTVTEDTANDWHRLDQSITVATGSQTLVVYAKQNSGTRYLTLSLVGGNNNWEGATFDLAGGSPVLASGSSSTFTSPSATQTASGNGYYKCVLKATGLPVNVRIHLSDVTSPSYTSYGSVQYTGNGSSINIAFASLTSTGATDYQATTTQIHRAYAPTLKSVSTAGQPRFEYSPTDSASEAIGQSRGLLIEGSATNLIPNSSAINSWATVGDVTITDSAAVGPDGTLSASLVRPTTVNSYLHYVRETITTVASSSYTFSAYVKPAGYTKVQLFFYQTSSPYTTGAETIFTLTGSGSASTAVGSSTITAVGGGYYRISVTGVAGTTATFAAIRLLDDSGSNEFTGDGYSGILCTGVQFELGSHCSSLISTSGSQATRASDSASITSSSLFDNGQGAVVVDASASGYNFGRFFALSDGGSNDNSIQMFAQSTTQVASDWRVGGTTVRQMSKSGLPTLSGGNKAAVSWETNQLRQAFNGTETNTYTTYPAAPLTKLDIGCWGSGNQANGHCKRIAVYGEPLSQTELESLTS